MNIYKNGILYIYISYPFSFYLDFLSFSFVV